MKAVKVTNSEPIEDVIIHHEAQSSYRLNKYISDNGYASRRGADKLIEAGRVTLDGKVAELGQQVEKGMVVRVDENLITQSSQKYYIILNKPVGITCTTDTAIKENLTDFMDFGSMIFPIGRLDKDSSGLLLMTNDGDVVNKILREEYGHDKEYLVRVDKPLNQKFMSRIGQGVEIYNPVSLQNQVTQKCDVTQVGQYEYKIILRQGLNRQIRRMTSALGYKVMALKRLRIMNIFLDDLPMGHWRYLSQSEMVELNRDIEGALENTNLKTL